MGALERLEVRRNGNEAERHAAHVQREHETTLSLEDDCSSLLTCRCETELLMGPMQQNTADLHASKWHQAASEGQLSERHSHGAGNGQGTTAKAAAGITEAA